MAHPKTFQLACPKCGCGTSTVKDSRGRLGRIYRRRACRACDHRYTSCEAIGLHPADTAEELVPLRDALRAALAAVTAIIDQEGVST